jgi:hypothetical protein
MLALAVSKSTRAEYNDRVWIAADMDFTDDSEFLTGILGYASVDVRTQFDEESWSWLKGTVQVAEGAAPESLVPFAVDLDEHKRWVAFAPSGRLTERNFPQGFQATLNEALRTQHEGFSDWEVDIVSDTAALREWVRSHPEVTKLQTIVRLPNPGRDLSADREQMRRLGAWRKREIFDPPPGGTLNLDSEVDDLTADVDQTNVDVEIQAREGNRKTIFNSRTRREQRFIDEFGEDLRTGIESVLEALRAWSAERTPPTNTGDPADETVTP